MLGLPAAALPFLCLLTFETLGVVSDTKLSDALLALSGFKLPFSAELLSFDFRSEMGSHLGIQDGDDRVWSCSTASSDATEGCCERDNSSMSSSSLAERTLVLMTSEASLEIQGISCG